MNGLLLAAGLGTRFRPFTDILPKPAIPLLNVPTAFYNLHLLQQMGLRSLTVNTHHLPNEIVKIFNEEKKIEIPVTFSPELGEILGTGGAIKKAQRTLEGGGSFMVANADVVNGFGINDITDFHKEKNALATMVVIAHPEAGKKYGAVWVNKENEVVKICKENTDPLLRPFHFVGIHMISDRVFDLIPEGPCDINRDVYLKAISQGEKVVVLEKSGAWFDAGSLSDFLEATKNLLGLLPVLQHQPFFLSFFRRFWKDFDSRPNLWEGKGCEHLLSLGAQANILLGSGCKVHPSVRVKGFAVFGDEAIVEEGVELENVVIGPNVVLKKNKKYLNTLVLS